ALRSLADAIERADGAPPLSDRARARLTSPDVTHLVVRDGGQVVAYGQLEGTALELVGVAERVGVLLDEVDPPLLVWTHGRRSQLIEVLDARGFVRTRELHQLRRPTSRELPPDPPLAEGVRIRTFEAGRDESAWLALNAAAFAHHPEQGATTAADLAALMAEPWFDPAGFLLAEQNDELLGFHWTKVHSDGAGEVYVLGVAPAGQGLGLGGALLIRGLRLLQDRGCPYVLLYVDGDNPGALHLYERDGFERFDLDVQWQSPTAD
ncbi:MAG: mycothiol synthase, partial [Jatrophihabitans sp.]